MEINLSGNSSNGTFRYWEQWEVNGSRASVLLLMWGPSLAELTPLIHLVRTLGHLTVTCPYFYYLCLCPPYPTKVTGPSPPEVYLAYAGQDP